MEKGARANTFVEERLLKGKVVVITGGSGLLGQEFVKTVIENGGTAVLADIDVFRGERLIKNDPAFHVYRDQVEVIKLDITSKISIATMVRVLQKKYRRIDALVNNAYPRNKNYGRDFFNVEYADFCENINLHLGGYFLISQQLSRYFKKQGYGNIINIGSIYGVIAPRFELYEDTVMTMPVEYAAIKASIIHLTKYMASYFKGNNIRVNCISPGGVLNNQPKSFLKQYQEKCSSKGMLNQSDCNGTLLYLLSDMSEYVNGQNLIVDDGMSL